MSEWDHAVLNHIEKMARFTSHADFETMIVRADGVSRDCFCGKRVENLKQASRHLRKCKVARAIHNAANLVRDIRMETNTWRPQLRSETKEAA